MKIKFILFLILLGLSFAPLHGQTFGYPIDGEPWYYIEVEFFDKEKLGGGEWTITSVAVDNLNIRDYSLFQDRSKVYDRKISGDLSFKLKARFNWEGGQEYTLSVNVDNVESKTSTSLKRSVTSPSQKGYWNPEWKNYLSLRIMENNKHERTNYPVHITVGVLSQYFHGPEEIRVIRPAWKGKNVVYTEIPSQVYDVVEWKDKKLLSIEEKDEETGQVITRYHPTTTFSLAFLADLKRYAKASFLIFYNNSAAVRPEYPTDLSVEGQGLGKTVSNAFYEVTLDEKSGMIFGIVEKNTGLKLEHKLETNGAVHWNPGVYSPPHAWSHCSDWENPDYTEITGPVFYSLQRRAPLPHLDDVHISINYYFYKDCPFILMESTMLINDNLYVKALRNGEIVFSKQVFDKAAYKTPRGRTVTVDFSRTRKHPEHAAVLSPDTPWITLFNKDKNIAFTSLFLQHAESNLYGGPAAQQQPYIYIQHGPWYYFSRAFVYSFGSNNQSRMLPVTKGSIYYEKNAWIPFSFKKKKEYIHLADTYFNMLKHPLQISENIETYRESPHGWLVPILTEPFDEGVKKSIGGKKKKK
ncbi:MAG: hypothetical protein PVI11_04100 [Candidatus Aminicenantes bacterium]|jgi:hypothetical protein